ncbi:phage tail sheath family protein [Pedobacter hiemivivus]|uniref:Phage tail sheath family protein n=1 Tax=Pedobacter hiemivivus TaxID=2530454 RepID=A0A4R0NAE9_9SPHI|nr:phage tail sheath C-terminal domain-containing protein [Pedobacter hiemivivus]TCC97228.1 phage tail sheath family protein [Pedobacter hiemivivus]
MATHKSPGVYIEELPAFPNSAIAVETAIPAFVGYTFKAESNGKSLIGVPTRINSFAEYVENFGGAFSPSFKIEADESSPDTFKVSYEEDNELYFFNSIRLFYANGGGPCVILAVDVYGDKENGLEVKASDFNKADGPLEILKNTPEPTLVVMPDVIKLKEAAYAIYTDVLAHCDGMQSRFAIFDLKNHDDSLKPSSVVDEFRSKIGNSFLNYGAAYYPWLNTSVVEIDELTFENLPDSYHDYLEDGLPQKIYENYKTKFAELDKAGLLDQIHNLNKNHHLELKSSSANYRAILNQARNFVNQLPPSAAIAGLYTMVDNTRGVWKSPANYSLNLVDSPVVSISSQDQEDFNVHPETGKSVNVIRPFQGLGTLVWGGRTLDGNSADWKYINVRRTLIMIEQSIKLATKAYVFEPNDANTWITVKAMVANFLTNLWKQGALAGAVPEQAFDVQIGLGATMTPTDILDGKMLISVKLAVVRPAEFIIITFQQQLQQS